MTWHDNLQGALASWQTGASAPRMLITGGPTCEDLDDVRFLSNRSTGRMGIALAETALARQLRPLLILGPTHLSPIESVPVVRVRSAQEMHDAVLAAFPHCDALIMSAAVADYRPAKRVEGKHKKQDGELVLHLERTLDILQAVAAHPKRPGKTVIGFALEPGLDLAEAKRKLESKDLDAIVANTTASFGAATATACILYRDGHETPLGTLGKDALAEAVIQEIDDR